MGSLISALRTPEQMAWIHDRFKLDGLERLSRADRDYADSHGYYLPDVAALAHAALTALATLAATLEDEVAMAEQSVETLSDLRKNWREIIEEEVEGEPLIENILYWLIEDVTPTLAHEALAASAAVDE